MHYNYQAATPILTQRLKEEKWFRFAEVDREIPEPLRPKFEEMCPFFYNKEVPIEAVPQHMLDYLKRTGRKCRDGRKLTGALSAKKILLYAPLLTCRWYLEHGAVSQMFIGRLTTNEDFHLVRGAGDGGVPDWRRGKKQGAAGRGVQAVRK